MCVNYNINKSNDQYHYCCSSVISVLASLKTGETVDNGAFISSMVPICLLVFISVSIINPSLHKYDVGKGHKIIRTLSEITRRSSFTGSQNLPNKS